tara:strand:+ start:235 stop:468 length:234 start_codon:yes stop_codon:yes gene_type:complete
MAEKRLRPGTYKATEDNTSNDKIQIDWNWFDIPRNSSIEFDVKNIAIYDDGHVTVFRIPPSPQTLVSNVGGDLKDNY